MTILQSIFVIFRWVIGALIILIGLVNAAAVPVLAIISFLLAAMIIPPSMRFMEKRAGREFGNGVKLIVYIVLFFAFFAFLPPSNAMPPEVSPDSQEAQDLKNEPSTQDDSQKTIEGEQPKEETKEPKENNPSPIPAAGIISTPTPKSETPKVEAPRPTYVAPKSSCDPNYSGCVPIASDVDCVGGEGNGPAYTGRTTVIGRDIYQLDRDGDGVACDK